MKIVGTLKKYQNLEYFILKYPTFTLKIHPNHLLTHPNRHEIRAQRWFSLQKSCAKLAKSTPILKSLDRI